MTSYAELLQACTEYQSNFAALNGKYQALTEELKNEEQRRERVEAKLQSSLDANETLQAQLRGLQQELTLAASYKDRYTAAALLVEQLKGRLEHARRSVETTLLEHDQEVEQLQTQIRDLLERVEFVAEGAQQRERQAQIEQLEALVAAQRAELLGSREHFARELGTAQEALQTEQQRTLEQQQRLHAQESEVRQLREVLRQHQELLQEAARCKDAAERASEHASQALQHLRRELTALQQRLEETTQRAEAERQAGQREAAQLRRQGACQVERLQAVVEDAARALADEREIHAQSQNEWQGRLQQARAEHAAELQALHASVQDARAEAQRQGQVIDRLQGELTRRQAQLAEAHTTEAQLRASYREAEIKLSTAAQQEAWLRAEQHHLTEQLQVAREEIEGLARTAQRYEAVSLDADKMRLQLELQAEELMQYRRAAPRARQALAQTQAAAEETIATLREQLKRQQKQLAKQQARSDALRRKLIHAVAVRETALRFGANDGGNPHDPPHSHPQKAYDIGESMQPSHSLPSWDVIEMLKKQNEQAELLHHRLVELSR